MVITEAFSRTVLLRSAHESPGGPLKWRLSFSRSGVEAEILLFWQASRWFRCCWFWDSIWGPRIRESAPVSTQLHPARWNTPIFTPSFSGLVSGAWSRGRGWGSWRGQPRILPPSTWDDLHRGGPHGPSALYGKSTLPCPGSHPSGLSAWGRTQALLACSEYLSFWKITVWYSGEKNSLSRIQEQVPRLLGNQPWEINFWIKQCWWREEMMEGAYVCWRPSLCAGSNDLLTQVNSYLQKVLAVWSMHFLSSFPISAPGAPLSLLRVLLHLPSTAFPVHPVSHTLMCSPHFLYFLLVPPLSWGGVNLEGLGFKYIRKICL